MDSDDTKFEGLLDSYLIRLINIAGLCHYTAIYFSSSHLSRAKSIFDPSKHGLRVSSIDRLSHDSTPSNNQKQLIICRNLNELRGVLQHNRQNNTRNSVVVVLDDAIDLKITLKQFNGSSCAAYITSKIDDVQSLVHAAKSLNGQHSFTLIMFEVGEMSDRLQKDSSIELQLMSQSLFQDNQERADTLVGIAMPSIRLHGQPDAPLAIVTYGLSVDVALLSLKSLNINFAVIQLLKLNPLPIDQLRKLLRRYRGVATLSDKDSIFNEYLKRQLGIGHIPQINYNTTDCDASEYVHQAILKLFTYE